VFGRIYRLLTIDASRIGDALPWVQIVPETSVPHKSLRYIHPSQSFSIAESGLVSVRVASADGLRASVSAELRFSDSFFRRSCSLSFQLESVRCRFRRPLSPACQCLPTGLVAKTFFNFLVGISEPRHRKYLPATS